MKLLSYHPAKLFGLSLLAIFLFSTQMSASNEWYEGKNVRINPQYKISRTSDGSVIVTSKDPKADFRQEFTDFYADLLMETYRKHNMNYIVETLRKKYYMSQEECRREIKHAINTLSEWKIILRDDDLAMD
jgi:hypothetical protein